MNEQENTIRECLTNIESLLETNMSRLSDLERELQSSKETVQELFNVIEEAKTNPVVLEMMNSEVKE